MRTQLTPYSTNPFAYWGLDAGHPTAGDNLMELLESIDSKLERLRRFL